MVSLATLLITVCLLTAPTASQNVNPLSLIPILTSAGYNVDLGTVMNVVNILMASGGKLTNSTLTSLASMAISRNIDAQTLLNIAKGIGYTNITIKDIQNFLQSAAPSIINAPTSGSSSSAASSSGSTSGSSTNNVLPTTNNNPAVITGSIIPQISNPTSGSALVPAVPVVITSALNGKGQYTVTGCTCTCTTEFANGTPILPTGSTVLTSAPTCVAPAKATNMGPNCYCQCCGQPQPLSSTSGIRLPLVPTVG